MKAKNGSIFTGPGEYAQELFEQHGLNRLRYPVVCWTVKNEIPELVMVIGMRSAYGIDAASGGKPDYADLNNGCSASTFYLFPAGISVPRLIQCADEYGDFKQWGIA